MDSLDNSFLNCNHSPAGPYTGCMVSKSCFTPFKDFDQTVEIWEAFKKFDRNGNGYIEAKELKHVSTRMG